MSHDNENEDQTKVWKMMKDVGVCMLVTKTGDAMRSRPVAAFAQEEAGTVYIMTDVNSHKDSEIEADPDVCLAFSHPGSNSYVSLSGNAVVSNDRAKIKELWNPWAKAWWSGPDDPNIRLLKVDPKSAEYWDSPNKIIATAIMAFKAVTGSKRDLGENKKVAM